MKLLLFSDLHTNTVAAARLVRMAEGADVVVGAGDFGNERTDVSACFEVLKRIHAPAVLVPGNNESFDELKEACASWPEARVLHGSEIEIAGQAFFGIGGGIPVTPYGSWSYDFSEAEAGKMLEACPTGAVLVSHSPPKGAVDVASSGRSLGSTALRDAVMRTKPRLVVCGHIHASAGQRAIIGSTTVINAGPRGVIYTL
ncbi:MAG: Ser/Thr protein phosphatase family protein [Pedosphaera sp.]|nr:Ser/Thr protein phosphatase family protein [Pedosphaera sp.]